jgi:anion-transporting  ArsA/GET3 family ATPase
MTMTLGSLLNRRLTIFTGKGGVGKSTVALAAAWAAAKAGKRTLLMQFAAHEKAAQLLGLPEVGDQIQALAPNLYAVKPSAEAAMREYVLLILHSKMAYKAVFENQLVQKFLRVIPGLNELLMLGKAFHHERERDRHDRPVWDRIIIDAPATGHSVYLFQVPFVIRDAISSGLMHREVTEMVNLLQDPRRAVVHLITLPEEMPVNETIQLRHDLVQKMGMPMGSVIVNGVFPSLFDGDQRALLQDLRRALPEDGDVLDRLVAAACFRTDRCDLQRDYIARLALIGMPLLELPYFFVPSLSRPQVEDIARRILLAAEDRPLGADDPLPSDDPPPASDAPSP